MISLNIHLKNSLEEILKELQSVTPENTDQIRKKQLSNTL